MVAARLRRAHSPDYVAVFAENMLRLPQCFHVVPSIRLERERVAVDEAVGGVRVTLARRAPRPEPRSLPWVRRGVVEDRRNEPAPVNPAGLAPAGIARRALLPGIEGFATDARVDRSLDVGGQGTGGLSQFAAFGFFSRTEHGQRPA